MHPRLVENHNSRGIDIALRRVREGLSTGPDHAATDVWTRKGAVLVVRQIVFGEASGYSRHTSFYPN